jgi:hypothetical protein
MEKKTWQTPTLITLVRSRPEEVVLSPCKGGAVTGPATQINSCYWSDYPPGGCINPPSCSVVSVS